MLAEMTIVTYGGSEILYNIFNAIALLINGNKEGIIRPLAIITASIGGVWAVTKAYFSHSAESLLAQYFLPLIAIPTLLMIPTSKVRIEDVLKHQSYTVDHVPYFLAKVSELTSTVGDKLTTAMESVMHTPNELSYKKTGIIFGAETALDITKYKITNAALEQNLSRFVKQCVFYDIALGRYSLDELKKTTDLWDFLKENSSKVRMINYVDSKEKGGDRKGVYKTCREALAMMEPVFENEKNYYAQHDILKNLPLTFQALTALQKSSEELISQQLMMNSLVNGLKPEQFAKYRAQTQQRSTYQIMGSLVAGSLVTMRIFFEALIYGCFVLIIPLALLPGGVKFIVNWLSLTFWIQLWAPIYVILNSIMQTVSKGYAITLFSGLSPDQQGLSLFTSIGLQDLNDDIYALTGYMGASIPFISFGILRGAQSFVHLASSMLTPAHSAAASAASEQTSGNYSFANTSMGQSNYHNTSAFQSNTAPTVSSGYFTENYGSQSITHAGEEKFLRQSNSELRTGVFSDDSISTNLQNSYQKAQTHAETSQQQYMESISNHARSMSDVTDHLSKSTNFAENASAREAYDIQESARYLQNVSDNWGHQYGLNSRQSLDTLLGAGLSASLGLGSLFLSGDLKGSGSFAVSDDEALSSALNIASSEDFQRNFQKITDFSKNTSYSSLNDEGTRIVEGFTQSLDNVRSTQEQYQSSLTQMHQVSENLSWVNSHSHLIKRSLNQDFINWASERFDNGYSEAFQVIENGSQSDKDSLINDFISHTRTENPDFNLDNFQNPLDAYTNTNIDPLNATDEWGTIRAQTAQAADERDLMWGIPDSHLTGMMSQHANAESSVNLNLESTEHAVASSQKELETNFDAKYQQPQYKRLWNEGSERMGNFLSGTQNFSGKYQNHDRPYWNQSE